MTLYGEVMMLRTQAMKCHKVSLSLAKCRNTHYMTLYDGNPLSKTPFGTPRSERVSEARSPYFCCPFKLVKFLCPLRTIHEDNICGKLRETFSGPPRNV